MRAIRKGIERYLLEEFSTQVALFVLLDGRVDVLNLAAHLVMKAHHHNKLNSLQLFRFRNRWLNIHLVLFRLLPLLSCEEYLERHFVQISKKAVFNA